MSVLFGLEEHAYNGAGTLNGSKYYYSLGGRMIGKTSGSGAPTFFLTDMLGSVLADFSGASGTSAVSGNQTFCPYGNLQYFKGSMGTVNGSPLPFVAQFSLFEIAPYDKDHLLPDAGIMSFFFDLEAFFESQSFDQPTTWYVCYTPDPLADMERLPMPESMLRRGRYRTSGITYFTEITLPDYSKYAPTSIERLGLSSPLTDKEERAYYQIQAQLARRAGATYHVPIHRLLGHPDNIQWDMYDELGGVPADWQLLFQVDSDHVINSNWGDTGRIYYWIRAHDLAEKNFSQVKLILQST